MLYSMLIYARENTLDVLDENDMQCKIELHKAMQAKAKDQKKLGPFAQLMPTGTAVTLRQKSGKIIVTDGPFAETKEQLMGLYLIEADGLDDVIALAETLPLEMGSIEIRPVNYHELHTPG